MNTKLKLSISLIKPIASFTKPILIWFLARSRWLSTPYYRKVFRCRILIVLLPKKKSSQQLGIVNSAQKCTVLARNNMSISVLIGSQSYGKPLI